MVIECYPGHVEYCFALALSCARGGTKVKLFRTGKEWGVIPCRDV
ncbi:hypothetical protein CHA_P10089 [Pseudomonas phage CHA_P1]|uniref:Uncharacterized protein n=1 Tax=Pseudomonas phage CHA_P1 TaxID=1327965 RepID=V5JVE5_9CAUD|nr:hypothetical protein X837_gp089 [Pseudomonas phage CHA_P1]AGR89043.1 hypothetical protein CHA_P10089 [Pseudomonas phage CHA_P1]